MALNIKNQRVCDLARQAAQVTGRSQVSAIEEALERLIAQHEGQRADETAAKKERILAAARRFREGLTDEQLTELGNYKEWMYDEDGLPT